ncbi:MAG: DUF1963 domain-containing protein [Corynebacterium sp.]|uniref:DUF1963 domain-containing protein n=1 Tax=Corynebacterium sp. TaxID=1720 RepID=UPI0026DD13A2|nr:DUF1963 domain-containing protein [Corynebacterium sp.]MDO4761644.1 DUF1963 domain-containing protein [Corynebacterium sp.]
MSQHSATSSDIEVFDAWLKHRGISADDAQVQRCAFFVETPEISLDDFRSLWENKEQISWLGGPAPIAEQWPTNADGQPLTHIGSFAVHQILGKVPESERDTLSTSLILLPEHGYFSFFHDLEAYGGAEDSPESWRCIYVPTDPGDTELVTGPDAERFAAGKLVVGFSIAPAQDYQGDNWQAYEDATQDYLLQWGKLRASASTHPIPLTGLSAHSFISNDTVAEEYLSEVLPLGEHDFYVLFAQFESWTTLNGLFGDASPLEFWIRFSDLVMGNYHKVWAVIRTD